MTSSDARKIAVDYLRATEVELGIELVLLDESTLERAFGWVFFYDSRRHVESGSIGDALGGNAPIVITRSDGRLHETGTALPLEHYLKQFEDYTA